MIEVILQAPDADFFASEVARLGLCDDDGNLRAAGSLRSGGGYFINVVGTIYEPIVGPFDMDNPPQPVARPGYWSRVRLNGDERAMPDITSEITQYVCDDALGGWTADGKTLAPEWVGNVALIA